MKLPLNYVVALVVLPLLFAACGDASVLPTAAQSREPAASGPTESPSAAVTLPSEEEVKKAVADGLNIVEDPPQPPTIEVTREGCQASYEDITSKLCAYGDTTSTRSIVIYGDSHANMWMTALDAIGKHGHWNVVQLTKSGCQVPDFPRWLDAQKRPYDECNTFRTYAVDQIAQIHPDVLVITNNRKDVSLAVNGSRVKEGVDEAWSTGLESMLGKLKPLAGRIVIIGDMAYPSEAGKDCLTKHEDDVRPCNTPREEAVLEEFNQMEQKIAARNQVEYVDTIPWMCTDVACPAVVGGLWVHWDEYHITQNYALWLSNVLGTSMGLL